MTIIKWSDPSEDQFAWQCSELKESTKDVDISAGNLRMILMTGHWTQVIAECISWQFTELNPMKKNFMMVNELKWLRNDFYDLLVHWSKWWIWWYLIKVINSSVNRSNWTIILMAIRKMWTIVPCLWYFTELSYKLKGSLWAIIFHQPEVVK